MKKSLGSLALLAFATTNAFALTSGAATLINHKETNTLSQKAVFKDVAMPEMIKANLQRHNPNLDEPAVRLNAALGESIDESSQFVGSRSFMLFTPTAGNIHGFNSTTELCLYKITDDHDHMADPVGCTTSDDEYAVTGDYTFGYTTAKLRYDFKESGKYLILMDVSLRINNESTRYYTDSGDVFDVTIEGGKAKIVKASS